MSNPDSIDNLPTLEQRQADQDAAAVSFTPDQVQQLIDEANRAEALLAHQRAIRSDKLQMMSAFIASGYQIANHDMSDATAVTVARNALKIAQALLEQIAALP